MNLRRQSNKAYDTLAEKLRVDILAGRLKPGDAIQTETELAASFGISRNTVRKAVNILVGEGLLKKVQGSGTFVAQMDERMKGRESGGVQSRQILFLSMSSALSEECGRSVFLPIFENINKLLEKQS
ncbi:MAG: GntR family transcriptional regulator, partial [Lentisphaerae bacterium]|nr:GntR family transcriptional regulator [Lentisphaerota bacterium]